MTTAQTFAYRVREARREARLSQRDLAALLADRGCRMDSSAIARIETCQRAVKVDEAAHIARSLGTTVSALVEHPLTDWSAA